MEVGTAGIRLAQELLTPYDRLIIVDAMNRGGAPGTVYVSGWNRSSLRAKWTCTSRSPPVRGRREGTALSRPGVHRGLRAGRGGRAHDGVTPAVGAAVVPCSRTLTPRRRRASADPVAELKQRDEIPDHVLAPRGRFRSGRGPADISASSVTACDASDPRPSHPGRYLRTSPMRRHERYRLTPLGMQEGRRGSSMSSSPTWPATVMASAARPTVTVIAAVTAGAGVTAVTCGCGSALATGDCLCPATPLAKLIGRRYTLGLLSLIANRGTVRFTELRSRLGDVSSSTWRRDSATSKRRA